MAPPAPPSGPLAFVYRAQVRQETALPFAGGARLLAPALAAWHAA